MSMQPDRKSPTRELAGRSVLIAGASGGLGSAIAVDLAQRGAQLTLVGRNQPRLAALGLDADLRLLDLRDPANCESAVQAAVDHAGRLDIVVNAVGVVAFGTVAELTIDVMEELFMTNTFVSIMLARAALDKIAEGGVIVNISGVIADHALPGMAAYGASKAAVKSFDQAFAREARRRKVRVIDARPPHTETGLATRPLAGTSPNMPIGLTPASVARTIGDAIVGNVTDLAPEAFQS